MSRLETWAGGLISAVADPNTAVVGIAIWVVALIFLIAGLGKLAAPSQFAQALVNFGVGKHPSTRLATSIALAEVAVAVALVLPATRAPAMAVAVCAFVGFLLLISRSVAHGERFACACFGTDRGELSFRTLARSIAFLALACLTAYWLTQANPDMTASETTLQATSALALVAAIVLVVKFNRVRSLNREWYRGYLATLRAS
jgi:uncharacterized membrane protein YphA (DoxX/SURF4 family)